MSSPSTLRIAARAFPSICPRKTRAVNPLTAGIISSGLLRNFSTTSFRLSDKEETFEEFTARFEKEFEKVTDVFDLQRNLNNAFAYDLVPSPTVITAALRAARRVNDFPTAVRIFEGIKAKVENKGQYEQYLEELKPLREELSIPLKEDMYPEKE
ncbi:Cytochrome c oxidase subunit 6, mitochondrial [Golovinomyces cichoracearum]|uniref:Cytochrome c oxidase subunit 6, mitochondrial n=1 Tax=Golovinomyces cichoracearum TaxID=62708 RepID=A0A420HI79_9PEZI|nr:Cytochrome c oxidase subunit 6, mitochondrial [Golovinomyces cichoracearum]